MEKTDEQNIAAAEAQTGETWIKPEVTSFAPVKAAEGISYNPLDGLTNMTP